MGKWKNIDNAKLSNRVSELRQRVNEMMHYWKIRCNERKTLLGKRRSTEQIMKHIEMLEKSFNTLLNRKRWYTIKGRKVESRQNNVMQPVYLTYNDANRLRQFLSEYYGMRKYVKYKKNKRVVHLNIKQHNRLTWLLNKDKK